MFVVPCPGLTINTVPVCVMLCGVTMCRRLQLAMAGLQVLVRYARRRRQLLAARDTRLQHATLSRAVCAWQQAVHESRDKLATADAHQAAMARKHATASLRAWRHITARAQRGRVVDAMCAETSRLRLQATALRLLAAATMASKVRRGTCGSAPRTEGVNVQLTRLLHAGRMCCCGLHRRHEPSTRWRACSTAVDC